MALDIETGVGWYSSVNDPVSETLMPFQDRLDASQAVIDIDHFAREGVEAGIQTGKPSFPDR